MESDAAVHPGQPASAGAADVAVTALYQAHALGLIRLAYLMLGDKAAAEDVVQEAFTGLYRRWAHLSDPGKALPYVRSSILNACRTQLRHLGRPPPGAGQVLPPAISAEAAALSGEDRRAVLSALRRLPGRQREVLVLRYYLDLPEPEIAAAMGIGPSTVRSTAHRALAALARLLEEQPVSMLEDRVRRALRETAEEITPLDVPPLRLGQTAGSGPGGDGRLPRARRAISWPGWLTPLAAAAAVAAVLATTLALTGTLAGHRPAHRGQSAKPLRGVPRYYIVLGGTPDGGWPDQAVVRTTATSQAVATLTPPLPYNAFIMVAAAAGVGRYVLAAQRTEVQPQVNAKVSEPAGPIRFYQFWISSSGQVSSLRPLRVPEVPAGPSLSGLALTPDGRKLAVALQTPKPGLNPEIEVDTLATGAQRVWTWPGAQPIEESLGGTGSAVSWAADDRTLAFQRQVGSKIQVRLLDTAAPGSSLAASRVALSRYWEGGAIRRFRHGRAVNDIMTFGILLTPDGSKIVCATVTETQQPLTAELAFTEFSAQTGKVVAVLGRWRIAGHNPTEIQDVLWTNADGSTLLVAAHQPGATASAQGNFRIQFGVQRRKHYTPLPGAPGPNRLSVWPTW